MDTWSKGDYSRHIPEALMVVEKLPEVNPPSDRVPGQVRWAHLIFESPRWRNRGEDHEKRFLPRVSKSGVNIGQSGAPWGVPTTKAPSWRDQDGSHAR